MTPSHPRHSSAFTIVELLIVIVVIAILAAISIVAYNGIQERARVSEVSSALSQAKKKISVWQVDNPDTAPADLTTVGVANAGNVSYQYRAGTAGAWCITATSGPTSYKITNTTSAEQGGCAGHGQGGVAAVTNLAVNPSVESNNSGWQGWAGSSGTFNFSNPTTNGYDGSRFHRATWTAAGSGGGVAYVTPATAGRTYTTSMWVRTSKNASNLYCGWQNGGAAFQYFNTVANTWTRASCTGTLPNGQTSVQVNVYGFAATNGDWMDGDAGMVTEGATLSNFADGNSTNWVWNGSPNNSTSTGPAL